MTDQSAASPAGLPAAGPAFWLTVLMGVSFAVIWSSAFSVAKIMVSETPPLAVSAARFTASGLIAGGIAWALGQRLPRDRAAWRAILILGTCQNTLYLGFFFTAMTTIPAGLAAIIASAMPLAVAALAPAVLEERVTALKALGLALGFGGVIFIMGTRVVGGVDLFGVGLAIAGTLGLAVATLTVKKIEFGTGLLMVVACQMAVGAIGCLALSAVFEDMTAWNLTAQTLPVLIPAFAYQVLIPGIGATLLWFALVKRVSAAGASSFHFLNPAFGIAFAWVLLGEAIGRSDVIGVVLVAAGILLVNRSRSA